MQKSWMQEKNAECSGNTELLNVAEAQGLWKSEAMSSLIRVGLWREVILPYTEWGVGRGDGGKTPSPLH